MNKATVLSEKEKLAVINELRIFLQRKNIDQRDFAKRVGKTETTVSRWMSGKYPITIRNADAIRFIIGFNPDKQTTESPDDVQFLTFKAKMLSFIMQHPGVCHQCKKELYNSIQEFQMV